MPGLAATRDRRSEIPILEKEDLKDKQPLLLCLHAANTCWCMQSSCSTSPTGYMTLHIRVTLSWENAMLSGLQDEAWSAESTTCVHTVFCKGAVVSIGIALLQQPGTVRHGSSSLPTNKWSACLVEHMTERTLRPKVLQMHYTGNEQLSRAILKMDLHVPFGVISKLQFSLTNADKKAPALMLCALLSREGQSAGMY